ncbi:MAG: hypothetical protein ACPHL6_06680 [Rubripirellula sp.]
MTNEAFGYATYRKKSLVNHFGNHIYQHLDCLGQHCDTDPADGELSRQPRANSQSQGRQSHGNGSTKLFVVFLKAHRLAMTFMAMTFVAATGGLWQRKQQAMIG